MTHAPNNRKITEADLIRSVQLPRCIEFNEDMVKQLAAMLQKEYSEIEAAIAAMELNMHRDFLSDITRVAKQLVALQHELTSLLDIDDEDLDFSDLQTSCSLIQQAIESIDEKLKDMANPKTVDTGLLLHLTENIAHVCIELSERKSRLM